METGHLDNAAPPLWSVSIVGRPNVRITVNLDRRPTEVEPTSVEQYAVAGAVINAIPLVCSAPPGLVARPTATPFRVDHRG